MHNFRLLLVILLVAVSRPAAAGTFDGTWAVTVDCPRTPSGVLRYNYGFIAMVKDGALRGHHGAEGQPSWFAIDGTVAVDGAVTLKADGIVNLPDTALKHLQTGTKYSYNAVGKFDGSRGNAHRTSG